MPSTTGNGRGLFTERRLGNNVNVGAFTGIVKPLNGDFDKKHSVVLPSQGRVVDGSIPLRSSVLSFSKYKTAQGANAGFSRRIDGTGDNLCREVNTTKVVDGTRQNPKEIFLNYSEATVQRAKANNARGRPPDPPPRPAARPAARARRADPPNPPPPRPTARPAVPTTVDRTCKLLKVDTDVIEALRDLCRDGGDKEYYNNDLKITQRVGEIWVIGSTDENTTFTRSRQSGESPTNMNAPVQAHTHPIIPNVRDRGGNFIPGNWSNLPSAADFACLIAANQTRGPRYKYFVEILATPVGIWAYTMKPVTMETVRQMGKIEKKKIRGCL